MIVVLQLLLLAYYGVCACLCVRVHAYLWNILYMFQLLQTELNRELTNFQFGRFSCGVPEVPYIIDWALLCRGEVLSRSSRAEWPQLAFGCRTLWTHFTFKERRGKCDVNASENETRKEKKNKNKINERHHIPIPCFFLLLLFVMIRAFSVSLCVCVKDMLKVEKVNRCVCKSVAQPRHRLRRRLLLSPDSWQWS